MSSALNRGNDEGDKEPAISQKAARSIALAFAGLIIAFIFAVMVMLGVWALAWLYEILFG